MCTPPSCLVDRLVNNRVITSTEYTPVVCLLSCYCPRLCCCRHHHPCPFYRCQCCPLLRWWHLRMHSRNTAEVGARGGTWGGSADFVALTALYVFAFHMAMGVRLLWLALLRFNVGWSGSGGPLRLGPGNNGDGKWRRK